MKAFLRILPFFLNFGLRSEAICEEEATDLKFLGRDLRGLTMSFLSSWKWAFTNILPTT